MKLQLGVLDLAYTAGNTATTTLKVANILESKYHVMETFYELHHKEIDAAIADSVRQAIGAMAADEVPRFKLRVSRIKAAFSNYLDSGEWEHVSGQYIAAAHNRHRIAHRDGSHEQSRSSNRAFIRTGLYRQSFFAWIDP